MPFLAAFLWLAFVAAFVAVPFWPSRAATLTETITCPDAKVCPGIDGWLYRYTLKAPDGTLGYTHVLVRKGDVIARKTVACQANDNGKCQGRTFKSVKGTAAHPAAKRVVDKPGTRQEDVRAQSAADSKAFADKTVGEREADWSKRK